ncbi:MAG: putative iron(3+)-hydroxamate import system permease protein FhuB, partial [Anaerospora sp.]|nr:putative iron(3+)-hydroxamate import system permease protein FhuB [Anaerospora sp.]
MISNVKKLVNRSADSRERIIWRMLVLFVFALIALSGMVIGLMKGAVNVPASTIVQAIVTGGAGVQEQIIWNIRLPRILVGALVGLNLALSGAILQAVMKNPLADPHIIGISSGAGLAGIIVLV